eukprot:PITA_04364
MTPKEAFAREKSHVGHLRIFGYLTYSYIPKEQRMKLEPMAEKGIFMGYNETSKAYWILIPSKRRVVIRRGVKFEEERAYRRSREEEEAQVASRHLEGSGVRWPPKRVNRESVPPEQCCSYVAKATGIVDSEPTSYEEAASQEVWREAMVEEYASIIKNNVWEVVPRPEGKSVVNSRWLYKIKHAAYGSIEKFKARFVARGFSQIEGVDYDETFDPVAWYTLIRSLIYIAAEMGWQIH